jgi:hypothetical protein
VSCAPASTLRSSLQTEIDRIARLLSWTVDVRDDEQHVLAHAGPPVDAATAAQHPLRVSSPIAMRDGHTARLEFSVHAKGRPPGPPWLGFTGIFTLFVVGVAAMLTARSLARPLQRLTEAARAFAPVNTVRSRVRLAKKALRTAIEVDPVLAEELGVDRHDPTNRNDT